MNKKTKQSINNDKFILCAIIIFVFAYFGFYPFNLEQTKQVHIRVYDNLHLAFNIPNIKTPEGNYYCSLGLKEKQMKLKKEIKVLEQTKKQTNVLLYEINEQIRISPANLAINCPAFRPTLTTFDINRLEDLNKNKYELEKEQKIITDKINKLTEEMYCDCKKIN